mgnify:CR=1 FL=1
MCYLKNIGRRDESQRVCGIGLLRLWLMVVWGIALLSLNGCQGTQSHSAPWFGRGQNLPQAPITILTSVDLRRGVVGVLELGMKRKQVEAVLGVPLVAEMPSEEALRRGVDPEDVSDNLYGGVFAWVNYSDAGEVISIEFWPRQLRERMRLEQKLLVQGEGGTLVLSSQTDGQAVRAFLKNLKFKRIRDYGHYIVVEFDQGSCAFHFDWEGHFEMLSL